MQQNQVRIGIVPAQQQIDPDPSRQRRKRQRGGGGGRREQAPGAAPGECPDPQLLTFAGDSPSRTPPVETTTSRNKSARTTSPNFRGSPFKLRRILQMFTKFRRNRICFAEFDGTLQNSAQIVGISAKILRSFASIFVSTGRCFDWWRPAPIMVPLAGRTRNPKPMVQNTTQNCLGIKGNCAKRSCIYVFRTIWCTTAWITWNTAETAQPDPPDGKHV